MQIHLIKNALMALPQGLFAGHILLNEGHIAAIHKGEQEIAECDVLPQLKQGRLSEQVQEAMPTLPAQWEENAHTSLDAKGLLALPGGIDVHTHFNLTIGQNKVCDGFRGASLAALHGGTTSIMEHPSFGPHGCSVLHQVQAYQQEALGNMHTDYGFHLVIQPGFTAQSLRQELAEASRLGFRSAKAYTTYNGMLDDSQLLVLFQAAKEAEILVTVHAENNSILAYLRSGLPPNTAQSHPKSRPSWCEAEAVHRLLALARTVDVPLYFVHLSTAEGLYAIEKAHAQGQTVFAETCPQYLCLTDDCYNQPQGRQFICAPPLRTEDDQEALWQGLAGGSIQVLATDHCAYSLAQKNVPDSIFACPGGIPGVETRLPLLYTLGVLQKRISIKRFVEVTAKEPARLFGLHHKGIIGPNYDADIILINPALEKQLLPENLKQNVDYSPFSHISAKGWPQHVLLRGNLSLLPNLPPMGQLASQ